MTTSITEYRPSSPGEAVLSVRASREHLVRLASLLCIFLRTFIPPFARSRTFTLRSYVYSSARSLLFSHPPRSSSSLSFPERQHSRSLGSSFHSCTLASIPHRQKQRYSSPPPFPLRSGTSLPHATTHFYPLPFVPLPHFGRSSSCFTSRPPFRPLDPSRPPYRRVFCLCDRRSFLPYAYRRVFHSSSTTAVLLRSFPPLPPVGARGAPVSLSSPWPLCPFSLSLREGDHLSHSVPRSRLLSTASRSISFFLPRLFLGSLTLVSPFRSRAFYSVSPSCPFSRYLSLPLSRFFLPVLYFISCSLSLSLSSSVFIQCSPLCPLLRPFLRLLIRPLYPLFLLCLSRPSLLLSASPPRFPPPAPASQPLQPPGRLAEPCIFLCPRWTERCSRLHARRPLLSPPFMVRRPPTYPSRLVTDLRKYEPTDTRRFPRVPSNPRISRRGATTGNPVAEMTDNNGDLRDACDFVFNRLPASLVRRISSAFPVTFR